MPFSRVHLLVTCWLTTLPAQLHAALCSNWDTAQQCNSSADGGCQCYWENETCLKDSTNCEGISITSLGKQLGESCGNCFSESGHCGDCATDLSCACVGMCANPRIADVPSICVSQDAPCPCGEMCVLEGGDVGTCSANGKTCSNDTVPACGHTCLLTDNQTRVPNHWDGNDLGDNFCNTCTCTEGSLACTEMACLTPTTCLLSDNTTRVPNGWSGKDLGRNHCNSCRCGNGALACTRMACLDDLDDGDKNQTDPAVPPASGCRLKDGTQVANGWSGFGTGIDRCNTCICTNDQMVCTVMACGDDRSNPNGNPNQTISPENPNQTISPQASGCTLANGTQVTNGWRGNGHESNACNTCSCDNDQITCTDLDCDNGPNVPAVSAAAAMGYGWCVAGLILISKS